MSWHLLLCWVLTHRHTLHLVNAPMGLSRSFTTGSITMVSVPRVRSHPSQNMYGSKVKIAINIAINIDKELSGKKKKSKMVS